MQEIQTEITADFSQLKLGCSISTELHPRLFIYDLFTARLIFFSVVIQF